MRKDVHNWLEDKNILSKLPLMCMGFWKVKSKYHYFHHDYGHDMVDNFKLKEEIKALIRRW